MSKAHLDQAVPAGDITAQVQIFDDKIKTEKDNIEAARKALTQMDAQLDQKLSRSTDEKGADKAIQIRRSQTNERKKLQNEIGEAQKTIVKLQAERAPIASEARKVEAEVGPVKYIAALIYGDTLDQNVLEKAVRWVIIMIVLVFDPLAVLMLVAVNWSLKKSQPKVKDPEGWHQELVPDTETWPPYDPEFLDEPIRNTEWSVGPPPEWPEDDNRVDAVGQNGNDGLHYDDIPTAPPPPPEPKEQSLGTNINEYDSPSKSIEQEVDDLNTKPLNSLDRLNNKYGPL